MNIGYLLEHIGLESFCCLFQTSSLKRYSRVYNLREVASSCKVMRPKQCQLTVRLSNLSAYLCAVQSIFEFGAWNDTKCQVMLFRASAMLPIGLQ
jgi:hypothetical protein